MQSASRNLEEKYEIINQIERRIRRKKIEHIPFLENTTLQLPTLNNISLTFPINQHSRPPAVHSIHTPPPNQQLQNQLSRILQQHNPPLRDNSFNRIIFTHPLKAKATLHSTFRSNFLQSLEVPTYSTRYRSLSRTKLSVKSKS